MTSTPETPETPNLDGEDLKALREEIDELKAIPEEELVNPLPSAVQERTATPHPTDAIGSENWDASAADEVSDD